MEVDMVTHFYLKQKFISNPVKTLCSGGWVVKPKGPVKLASINCRDCLLILLKIGESRLALIKEAVAKLGAAP